MCDVADAERAQLIADREPQYVLRAPRQRAAAAQPLCRSRHAVDEQLLFVAEAHALLAGEPPVVDEHGVLGPALPLIPRDQDGHGTSSHSDTSSLHGAIELGP